METKHGDAVLVHDIRVDFAIVVIPGNHLATGRKTNYGPVQIPVILLELHSVAAPAPGAILEQVIDRVNTAHEAIVGLLASPPYFEMISTGEIALCVIPEPGDVNVRPANAIFIVRRAPDELRKDSGHAGACRIHEIPPYCTT